MSHNTRKINLSFLKCGSRPKQYSEDALEEAVRKVIYDKWPQKAVCQEYQIPRQVLCDKLKAERDYINRAPYKPYTPEAMEEAIRLVEEENLPQSVAAAKCGIPKATLYCRIGKIHGTVEKKTPKKTLKDKLAALKADMDESGGEFNALETSATESETNFSSSSFDNDMNLLSESSSMHFLQEMEPEVEEDLPPALRENWSKARDLIIRKKVPPGIVAKTFKIPKKTLSQKLKIGFMKGEVIAVPNEEDANLDVDTAEQTEEQPNETNCASLEDDNNNKNQPEMEDDRESIGSEGALEIKEEPEEEDENEEEIEDDEDDDKEMETSSNSVNPNDSGIACIKFQSKGRFYSEDNVQNAINVVIYHKWTQRDASRAYGVPRKVLHDRLKANSQYKSRSSYRSYTQAEMDEAVRLVTEENMPQRAAAKLFGIPRATLHGYVSREDCGNVSMPNFLPHQKVEFNLVGTAKSDSSSDAFNSTGIEDNHPSCILGDDSESPEGTNERVSVTEFDGAEEMGITCVDDYLECSLVEEESTNLNDMISPDTKSKLKDRLEEKLSGHFLLQDALVKEEKIQYYHQNNDMGEDDDQYASTSDAYDEANQGKKMQRRVKHDLSVYTREGTIRKRPQYRSYTQDDLKEAIRLVQEENLPQRTVCQRLGIPRTTLHDHICRVTRTGHHALPPNTQEPVNDSSYLKMEEDLSDFANMGVRKIAPRPLQNTVNSTPKPAKSQPAPKISLAPVENVTPVSSSTSLPPSSSLPPSTNYDSNAAEFLSQYKALVEVLHLSTLISQSPEVVVEGAQRIKLIVEKQLSEMTDYGVDRLALLFQVRQQAGKAFMDFLNSQMFAPPDWLVSSRKVMAGEMTVPEAAKKCGVDENVINRLAKRVSLQNVFHSAVTFENNVRDLCSLMDRIDEPNKLNVTAAEASMLDEGSVLSDAKLLHITDFIRSFSSVYLRKNSTPATSTPIMSQAFKQVVPTDTKPAVQNIFITTPEGVLGVLPVKLNANPISFPVMQNKEDLLTVKEEPQDPDDEMRLTVDEHPIEDQRENQENDLETLAKVRDCEKVKEALTNGEMDNGLVKDKEKVMSNGKEEVITSEETSEMEVEEENEGVNESEDVNVNEGVIENEGVNENEVVNENEGVNESDEKENLEESAENTEEVKEVELSKSSECPNGSDITMEEIDENELPNSSKEKNNSDSLKKDREDSVKANNSDSPESAVLPNLRTRSKRKSPNIKVTLSTKRFKADQAKKSSDTPVHISKVCELGEFEKLVEDEKENSDAEEDQPRQNGVRAMKAGNSALKVGEKVHTANKER